MTPEPRWARLLLRLLLLFGVFAVAQFVQWLSIQQGIPERSAAYVCGLTMGLVTAHLVWGDPPPKE